MNLAHMASPVSAIQRPREYIQVVNAGEYGFYAEHVTAEGAVPITQPLSQEGLLYAHPLEEMAEQEAVVYACLHSLPCFFRNDPDGRWGELAVRQHEESQECIDATYRSQGWAS
jgi:hypothetical protein